MTLDEIQSKVIMLTVSQYLGFPHFFGKLIDFSCRNKTFEVASAMKIRQARERNRREEFLSSDTGKWEAGNSTIEFDSLEELEQAAVMLFQEKFSNYRWLVSGQTATYPPFKVLFGPEPFKSQLNPQGTARVAK